MEHCLRLNVANADQFWCPINKFSLAPGFRLEGTLPLDVDLKYILRGVKTGKLIDVNGTVLGGVKKQDGELIDNGEKEDTENNNPEGSSNSDNSDPCNDDTSESKSPEQSDKQEEVKPVEPVVKASTKASAKSAEEKNKK